MYIVVYGVLCILWYNVIPPVLYVAIGMGEGRFDEYVSALWCSVYFTVYSIWFIVYCVLCMVQ